MADIDAGGTTGNFNPQQVNEIHQGLDNAENVVIDTQLNEDPSLLEITKILYDDVSSSIDSVFNRSVDSTKIRSMLTNLSTGIFGMPYQMPDVVDYPTEDSDFGEKYKEKIVSTMPVLFLSPGVPSFMDGYSDAEKESINRAFDLTDDFSVNDIITNPDTPFFSFKSQFNSYSKEANLAVRALANFMGLSGEEYDGEGRTFDSFMIENMINPEFKKWFGATTSLAFYIDSDSSVSESWSNSTTSSSIVSTADSYSDKAREFDFLAGATGTSSLMNLTQDIATSVSNVASGALNLVSLGIAENTINRLNSALKTVVAGGKMVFPEIWSSSDFSRSYSLTMKFRAPDPDPITVLREVYVPALLLVCLAAGRQIGTSANAYGSPYIIRGTYKSIFQCEMGIISSLDLTRGGDDKWNSLGMCTAIDVTLNIKDLYSDFMISNTNTGLLNNVAQLDYLALLAGIDMNTDWVTRNLELRAKLFLGSIKTLPSALFESFKFNLNRTTANFVKKVLPNADPRFN